MTAPAIPEGRPLRVVGDVHGDVRAFSFAADTDRFIIQLGDLTDSGPDSAGALRLMFRLIDEGRGLFVIGNHDRKLGRVLKGERVKVGPDLEATLASLDAPMRARALQEAERAPAWLVSGNRFFVHAAFHSRMVGTAPPPPLGPVDPLLSRALFGETTGRTQADGFPERLLRWGEPHPRRPDRLLRPRPAQPRRPSLGGAWRQRRVRGVHGYGRGEGWAFVVGGFGLGTFFEKKQQKTSLLWRELLIGRLACSSPLACNPCRTHPKAKPQRRKERKGTRRGRASTDHSARATPPEYTGRRGWP